MAKSKGGKKTGGPYLAAAFFCENVLEDKHDGALSAIRIIDTMTFQLGAAAPEDFPSETNRLPVPISAILSFKTGYSPGPHTIEVRMESPSGKMAKQGFEQTLVATDDPQGGINMRLNNVIFVKKGGLFWFHVFLDGKRVTRMPLLIKVERAPTQPTQVSNGPPSTPAG